MRNDTRKTTFALLDGLDKLVEDSYNDLFWEGTDRDYIYHGSHIDNEDINGIATKIAFFSDSRYDAAGYGQHIVKIKRDLLDIAYLRDDPRNEIIPEGKDGIGYLKGSCTNYIIYSSAVNDHLEKCER